MQTGDTHTISGGGRRDLGRFQCLAAAPKTLRKCERAGSRSPPRPGFAKRSTVLGGLRLGEPEGASRKRASRFALRRGGLPRVGGTGSDDRWGRPIA